MIGIVAYRTRSCQPRTRLINKFVCIEMTSYLMATSILALRALRSPSCCLASECSEAKRCFIVLIFCSVSCAVANNRSSFVIVSMFFFNYVTQRNRHVNCLCRTSVFVRRLIPNGKLSSMLPRLSRSMGHSNVPLASTYKRTFTVCNGQCVSETWISRRIAL